MNGLPKMRVAFERIYDATVLGNERVLSWLARTTL